MLEEMRWLEYGQRLKTESRGVLVHPEGGLARRLLEAATRVGADSLGVVAGRIAPGAWADLVAVDLGSPLLAPGLAEQGLAGLLLGCGDEVIVNSCVGGEWLRPWPAAATRAEPSWSGAP